MSRYHLFDHNFGFISTPKDLTYDKLLISRVEKKLKKNGSNFILDFKDIYQSTLNKTNLEPRKKLCKGVETLSRISIMLTHYYKNIDNSSMSFTYLSNRYFFSNSEIKSLINASEKYFTLTSKNKKTDNNTVRSRKFKTILWKGGNRKEEYINSLRSPRDSQNIDRFIERLWSKISSNSDEIIWFINYLVEHSWQTDNKIAFYYKQDVEKFLTALKTLGFSDKEIQITLRYGLEQQPRKLKNSWKKSCSLIKNYRNKIVVRKGTNKKYGDMGELRISVFSTKKGITSDALRFAAGLMYIYIKSDLYNHL